MTLKSVKVEDPYQRLAYATLQLSGHLPGDLPPDPANHASTTDSVDVAQPNGRSRTAARDHSG
jgi:hypothetical protein